jgi:hypothetical protein
LLTSAFAAHVHRFGPLRDARVKVIEFPATGTTNPLGFLSSNVIVLNSAMCDYIAGGPPDALQVVSHELAHRWFGGVLRANGSGTRWLVESFAEYYSWRSLREVLGEEQFARATSDARNSAGPVPVRISSLGWNDDHVYAAGALGVLALAEAVGEAHLDGAIRSIGAARSEWSVPSLFDALITAGAARRNVERFRAEWGI